MYTFMYACLELVVSQVGKFGKQQQASGNDAGKHHSFQHHSFQHPRANTKKPMERRGKHWSPEHDLAQWVLVPRSYMYT